MPKYNCKINPEWLKMPKYSTWLQLVPNDETKLHCKSCNTSFDILNMRKSAVESHYNRAAHKNRSALLNAQPISGFFTRPTPTSLSERT